MSSLALARRLLKLANGDEEGSPKSPTSTDEPGESKEEMEEEEAAADPKKKIPRQALLDFFRKYPNPVDDQVHEFAEAHGASPHTVETQIYGILSEKLNQTKTAAFFDELRKIGQEMGEGEMEGEEGEDVEEEGLDEEGDEGPFVGDIEQMTEENEYFRRVLHTGQHAQLVLMTLQVGEELEPEVHPDIDQFFRIEEGEAVFVLDGEEHELEAGGAVVIPAGTQHEVINASETEPLKVYTIYSPPKHPPGTLDETLEDAKQREANDVSE